MASDKPPTNPRITIECQTGQGELIIYPKYWHIEVIHNSDKDHFDFYAIWGNLLPKKLGEMLGISNSNKHMAFLYSKRQQNENKLDILTNRIEVVEMSLDDISFNEKIERTLFHHASKFAYDKAKELETEVEFIFQEEDINLDNYQYLPAICTRRRIHDVKI